MKVTSIQTWVGCAGWSVPKDYAPLFAAAGSHLERYAGRFPAVEINSSFYRPHRPATYERWAASVPASFRFAVKIPREITHERRLIDTVAVQERFLGECSGLADKLGPLLVQLPPSLSFKEAPVRNFFKEFRARFRGEMVCEPRHRSWFLPTADQLLKEFQVARVAADPAVVPAAAAPGGWDGVIYFRWHGSPEMYASAYTHESLDALTPIVLRHAARAPVWCIFDNTTYGAATVNALDLLHRLPARLEPVQT